MIDLTKQQTPQPRDFAIMDMGSGHLVTDQQDQLWYVTESNLVRATVNLTGPARGSIYRGNCEAPAQPLHATVLWRAEA